MIENARPQPACTETRAGACTETRAGACAEVRAKACTEVRAKARTETRAKARTASRLGARDRSHAVDAPATASHAAIARSTVRSRHALLAPSRACTDMPWMTVV